MFDLIRRNFGEQVFARRLIRKGLSQEVRGGSRIYVAVFQLNRNIVLIMNANQVEDRRAGSQFKGFGGVGSRFFFSLASINLCH